MKKLFVSIVAIATVLTFTSCGNETPTITLPSDALVIDLGDKASALVGVKAEDNKNDLTDKILVTGLDFVGNGQLTYSVSNDEGTTDEKRDVTINTTKLLGHYQLTDGNGKHDVAASASSNLIRLLITGYGGFNLIFEGDGVSTTMKLVSPTSTETFTDSDGDEFTLPSGEITYSSVSGNYAIHTMKYTMKYTSEEIGNVDISATLAKE